MLAASVWCGSLLADRQRLNDGLIRFHVVANSDSEEDQSVKLQVRDAVLNSLQSDLNKIADVNEARAYLQAKLPQIQAVANSVLEATGCDCEAVVTLCKEAVCRQSASRDPGGIALIPNRCRILYYTHPYSSYKRVTNEKQSLLVRRLVLKGKSLDSVTDEQIAFVEQWINNLPQKIFRYRCSDFIFKSVLFDIAI